MPHLVVIAGPIASGKSTIADALWVFDTTTTGQQTIVDQLHAALSG